MGEKDRIQILENIETSDFKIGDIVTFTNEFGVQFENLEILGFRKNQEYLKDREIYLNKSSYWFPVKISEISK